jgi:hypothetical protein
MTSPPDCPSEPNAGSAARLFPQVESNAKHMAIAFGEGCDRFVLNLMTLLSMRHSRRLRRYLGSMKSH